MRKNIIIHTMKTTPKRIILLFLLIIVCICDVIVTISVSNNLLDNDTSSEMILSKCLYDEKSIVCPDWYYGTEVRIINQQLVFAPLFGLFSDWTMVRIVGVLIIQLILLTAFVFMLKSVPLETDSILLGCSLLLLPYCVAYGRIVLYHNYYALYIALVFLICGFLFRILNHQHPLVNSILLGLFCIIGCLNGIRIAFIGILPICALSFWCFLRTKNKELLGVMFFCAAAGIIGLLLFTFVISNRFNINTTYSFQLRFKGISEIYIVLFSILRQFGYRSGITRGTFLSLMSFAGIGTAVYAIFLSGMAVLLEKDSKKMMLKGMLIVQLLLTAFSFLFIDLPYSSYNDYARYLVPASVWVIPLFCMKFEEAKNRALQICFYAVLIIFIGNGLINSCFFYNPHYFPQEYDGLPFKSTNSAARYDNAIRFIKEEGFDMGYAFSEINVISEIMDGFPMVGIECRDGRLYYLNWLTRTSYRETPAERAFLIADLNEAKTFRGVTDSEISELVFREGDRILIYEITDMEAFRSCLHN